MSSNEESVSDTALLPDEEIDDAVKFGFDDYSTALASIIASKSLQTPFTIAIHGDWGSGKTSLMKTVAKKLDSFSGEGVRVKTIWFNAWEFEKLSVPLWTVFLNHVIMELEGMVQNHDLKVKMKSIGRGIIALSADILLRKITGISLKEADETRKNIWTDIKKISSLREELSQHIKEALNDDRDKRQRLAIFIDDLDRCLPEQTVEIFESIKLFLNSENCVFIIGMDKEQIRRAFELKSGGRESSASLSYVEKFIQLQFDLPRKIPAEVEAFLRMHASSQLKRSPKTIELISRFIEPNPRKIKRWINSVLFLERLFRVKQEKHALSAAETDVSIVSIWLFLKSFFPDFATFLESDLSLLNTAIRVASNKGSEEDKKKIGDFRIDKRLSEFLSLLKPDYKEEQMKDVVFLSKLTTSQSISILPKDRLKRIAEMSREELSNEITTLNEESVLSLSDQIIENLRQVSDYNDYANNLPLYDLLSLLHDISNGEDLKSEISVKIFELILKSSWAFMYFVPKMQKYTVPESARKMFVERGLVNTLITLFAGSNNYESAGYLSAILANFVDDLSLEQIKTILTVSFENDQINCSWVAQKNLTTILTKHLEKITPEEKAKIKQILNISL